MADLDKSDFAILFLVFVVFVVALISFSLVPDSSIPLPDLSRNEPFSDFNSSRGTGQYNLSDNYIINTNLPLFYDSKL